MATFTYNRLIEFNETAKRYFATQTKETGFSQSLERNIELVRPFFEDKGGYNERANKINRDAAAKDTKHKGVILTDQFGRFRYTAAGLQRRDDLMNDLGEETIDFEPVFSDEVPEISLKDRMIYKGIVIDPEKELKEAIEVLKDSKPTLSIAE